MQLRATVFIDLPACLVSSAHGGGLYLVGTRVRQLEVSKLCRQSHHELLKDVAECVFEAGYLGFELLFEFFESPFKFARATRLDFFQ